MRVVVIVLSLVVLLVGCGDSKPPDETVSKLVDALSRSDYATAYSLLHPAHQDIVSEELFTECGRDAEQISSPRVESFAITGDVERTRDIPELGEKDVTEVGVNLTQAGQVIYRTWDVVKDDGDWRWLMAADQLDAFRTGQCPQM